MGIRQQNSGTVADGSTSFTVTLGQATLSTSRVVIFVGGNTIVNTPSGFTSRSPQVNAMGHYCFDAGTQTASSWVLTLSAGHVSWHVYEVESGSFDVSSGANSGTVQNSPYAYGSPTVTPTAGERVVLASLLATTNTAAAPSWSAWASGFVEQWDTSSQNTAAGEFHGHGSAVLAVTAGGSTAYSTTGTVTAGGSLFSQSAIVAAYVTSTPAPASQTAAPASDITTTGWTKTPPGAATFAATLDEATADDTDYVTSPASPTASPFEVKLQPLTDPQDDTGHTVSYRFRATGGSSNVVVGLYQGATLIRSQTVTSNPSSFTTGTFTLTTGEAALITDYTDLRIRVTATAA